MDIAALFLGRTPRKSCQHTKGEIQRWATGLLSSQHLRCNPYGYRRHHLPAVRTTHDEPIFSDRAKRNLESKETYEEFLELLNMYLQDTIDAEVFVNMPQGQVCLSDGDLFWQFRD
jgi:histone deacetylase complex regulatory component SIN3